jgi:AsmA protein
MRIVKYGLIGLLVVAALLVGAALLLPLFVDPNDHKGRIAALVEQQTGRSLHIEDDLRLTVFPRLGLELGRLRLGNAEGFAQPDFITIEHARASLRLRPLLRKQIEMETLELHGASVYLARDAEGHGNWEDLVRAGGSDGSAKAKGAKKGIPPNFTINGVDLREAQVFYEDQQRGLKFAITGGTLKTGPLTPGQPIDLTLSFQARVEGPQEVTIDTALEGSVLPDLAGQVHQVERLRLDLGLAGTAIPGGAQQIALTLQDARFDAGKQELALAALDLDALGVSLDLNKLIVGLSAAPTFSGVVQARPFSPEAVLKALGRSETSSFPEGLRGQTDFHLDFNGDLGAGVVEVTALQARLGDNSLRLPLLRFDIQKQILEAATFDLSAFGMALNLSELRVESLFSAPRLDAVLQIDPFNPREALVQLGMTPPATSDPEALDNFGLQTRITASTERVELADLQVILDQSTAAGMIELINAERPAIRLSLTLDQLDFDRYLPPASKDETTESKQDQTGPAAKEDSPLPLEKLHVMEADATVKIADLHVANLHLSNTAISLQLHEGKLKLTTAAGLYGGSVDSVIGLDAGAQPPRLRIREKIASVHVGPLLDDLQNGEGKFTGQGFFNADLTADAVSINGIKKSLAGTMDFDFRDGSYTGFNLGAELRRAKALLKGTPLPSSEAQSTDFSELRGSINAKNGILHLHDLEMKAPLLRVKGGGDFDVAGQSLDLGLATSVVGTSTGQGGRGLDELSGITVPVKISGPASKPEVGVDMQLLAAALAKREAEKQLEKHEKKIQAEVEKKLGKELGEAVGEKALDTFKGLFK